MFAWVVMYAYMCTSLQLAAVRFVMLISRLRLVGRSPANWLLRCNPAAEIQDSPPSGGKEERSDKPLRRSEAT